jgi:hypothetical protein
LSLAASPCITRGRRGWLGLTPWKTCTSYPFASLLGALRSGSFSPLPYMSPFGAILPCEQGPTEGVCQVETCTGGAEAEVRPEKRACRIYTCMVTVNAVA